MNLRPCPRGMLMLLARHEHATQLEIPWNMPPNAVNPFFLRSELLGDLDL